MAFALAIVMLVPISVHTIAGVSKAMLKRAMAEVDAIWRDVGVAFEWHLIDDAPGGLRVDVGNEPGKAIEIGRPLAWIEFVDGVPQTHIYASQANAFALLSDTTWIRGVNEMPRAAIDEYVGRALGRALAHEVGHYLFRSRVHDRSGVMATSRPTTELFGQERSAFKLTKEERARLAIVLQRNSMAQRAPAPIQ